MRRTPYPKEFRRQAVQLVRSGRSFREVAEALGVSQQSLRSWVKRSQLDSQERSDPLTSGEREELCRLRDENARLRQERDLLKRALAFLAAETETR